MSSSNAALYSLLIVLNAGLTALAAGLTQGQVPVPKEYLWLVPVAVAMLTALTALLPQARRNGGGTP